MTAQEVEFLPSLLDTANSKTADNILGLVGNTPLVRVNRLIDRTDVSVYVKLDQFNIGGSSKDRIGVNIVRQAIARGELQPGDRIIDFGAGNTAVGYALAGIATGHPVTLVANAGLSPQKADLLRLLGVTIIAGRADVPRYDPENWAAIAERHADEDPSTWWARQESTSDNPQAHIETTGPEIWHQTGGKVTHFLAAIATGGTVSGTGAYLHDQRADIEVIATDFSDGPNAETNLSQIFHREPGYEQLERLFPTNIDLDVIDRLETETKADVIDFGWYVARTEGLVLGPSSVLSLKIALRIAEEANPGAVIVSFSADSGRDYLSREYHAGWLSENGLGHIAEKYAENISAEPAG